MATKHFFKTLFIFGGMIILGLLGVYLVNFFGESREVGGARNSPSEVAN